MKSKLFVVLGVALLLLVVQVLPASADGIIIITPPVCPRDMPCPTEPVILENLDIRYHHVTVTIDQQVATTHVDQVFYNPTDMELEGTYFFPIPLDAAVSNFVLWVDGKPVTGEVLNADEARQIYNDIVQRRRDPALLEYAGQGAVQAHIYPIPAKGERRVELEYSQALTAENGLVRYVYPLNTEKFSRKPLESVSVTVTVSSREDIRAVYSPSHSIDVSREDDHHFTAGYEASQVKPDQDFVLYYSLGLTEAMHLFTYRDPSDTKDPDGFFMMLLAPRQYEGIKKIDKDVILVLDKSGSMQGEKFDQAQNAAQYILRNLGTDDRFYAMAFSSSIQAFSQEITSARRADEAVRWISQLSASGSTDIHRALLEAAAVMNTERPTYLIFLTDGRPTVGELSTEVILNAMQKAAPESLRLFAFGLGYDVDTFLLDSLTQAHHGKSTYVKPDEPLNEILSGFYDSISTPVLTNLSLDFGDMRVYDLFPYPLPDLFEGSQLVITGRYAGGGRTTIHLTGDTVNGEQTFEFGGQVFESDSRPEKTAASAVPRLWATRKIGYLLNQIRLQGVQKEVVDEIVHLSIRYGIVTPYTSYLVQEEAPVGNAAQETIVQEALRGFQATSKAPSYGAPAFDFAFGAGKMAEAEQVQQNVEEAGSRVKIAGNRTYVYQDNIWMDTAYDPQLMAPVKIHFLSDDYFRLAETRPDATAGMALGAHVILVIDGKAYEIVDQNADQNPVLPTPLAVKETPLPTTETTPLPTHAVPTIPGKEPESNMDLGIAIVSGMVLVIIGAVALAFWRWKRTSK